MITEQDLREAIAECQGQRNPTSSTCVKLAAYYALLDRIEDKPTNTIPLPMYSYAADKTSDKIKYQSDSEFSKIVNNMDASNVWPILDELMDVLHDTNKRLYNAVIRRLTQAGGG